MKASKKKAIFKVKVAFFSVEHILPNSYHTIFKDAITLMTTQKNEQSNMSLFYMSMHISAQ